MFDASGCQVGELWGTSGFEKLKIVAAYARGANSVVVSESQVTTSLYLVYGTELQGNGWLQFFKIPSCF